MIFHKTGPMIGQPRGYAFVTYKDVSMRRSTVRIYIEMLFIHSTFDSKQNAGASVALQKMHGILIGSKNIVVRMAKNIKYVSIDAILAIYILNVNEFYIRFSRFAFEGRNGEAENKSRNSRAGRRCIEFNENEQRVHDSCHRSQTEIARTALRWFRHK